MIYLYSGTPGSGKSLHQASKIWDDLTFGRHVIANYGVNLGMIRKVRGSFLQVDNYDLSPDFLVQYSRDFFKDHRFAEGKLRLYIDEAQILFNARSWDAKGRDAWIRFFTQHRKFGYDIILVAQFDRMLDRQLRSLIEYEIIHRKLSNFGFKGWLLSLALGGNTFVAVEVWYPMKEKVAASFFHYRKKYSKFFDTYEVFSSDSACLKSAEGGVQVQN